MKKIATIVCASFLLLACNAEGKQQEDAGKTVQRTVQTENLLKNLKKIHQTGFMFGHHDDPLYGIKWEGDAGRSDVKSVCGDYPAVMSFDLGHIELGSKESLDKISFDKIRTEMINQYKRGGMVSVSWHLDNPLTGGDSWDVKTPGAVTAILPGGSKHELFLTWLDRIAAFFNQLKTDEGEKVPVLFRPWHEHTGSWFWWGKNLCTSDQYKQLWQLTRSRLDEKKVDNLLYAYSPGTEGIGDVYMERYPGNEYVDLLGVDGYQFGGIAGTDNYIKTLDMMLAFMTEKGKELDKPIALTETGLEALPMSNWWTEVLLPVVEKYPVAYVLVWRNARERDNHFYAPYPGQASAADFVKFYENPKTLFSQDNLNLYK